MKGYSHKIITASAAILLGAPAIGVAGATIGSTFPDVDIKLGIPHRTYTHYWPFYVLAMGAIGYVDHTIKMTALGHAGMVALWWCFAGALMHILEDSFTKTGVPWIVPANQARRFSFKLTTTGGVFEKVASLAAVGLVFLKFPPQTWSAGLLHTVKYNTVNMRAGDSVFWHLLSEVRHFF